VVPRVGLYVGLGNADEAEPVTSAITRSLGAGLQQPGVNGDWSMKDVAAHLTGWHRDFVILFQAAQRNEPEPLPPWPTHLETDDEINAWLYETNRERPVHEVLDESHQLFQQLLAVIEGLPDNVRIEPEQHLVWLGDNRFPAGEFFAHFHDDHEPDIRAWLNSST
jgi:hypothetical protein